MTHFHLSKLKRIFTGYTTGKAQDHHFQCKTIVLISTISAPTATVFSIINFLEGHLWLAFIEALAVLLLIPCFKIVRNQKFLTFAKNLLLSNAIIVFTTLFVDGGIAGTALIWTLIFPFLAFLSWVCPSPGYG